MTDIPAGPPVSPLPPLPPAPPPPQPYQGNGGAAPIEVGFAGPAAQRRLTVLFRLILAIPHFIILYALGIAAEIVAIIGWFGALFTGALPQFAADFLSGVLRWQARVYAYAALLTDQYPPFSLDDADYAVRVATRPGPLNRLAVLFRIFLAIPAAIVVGALSYGLFTIAMFVIWLIVLITGRMPDSLHAAITAALRYIFRYYGYFVMLTSEYPSGLFGDPPGPGSVAGTAPYPAGGAGYPKAPGDAAAPGYPSAAGSPPAPAEPPAEGGQQVGDTERYQQVSGTGPTPAWGQEPPPGSTAPYGTPQPGSTAPYGTPQPGSTAPYGTPAPAPGPAPYGAYPSTPYGTSPAAGYGVPQAVSTAGWSVPGDPPWRLVLSQAARRLIVFFLVLGAIIFVGYIVGVTVAAVSGSTANRAAALSQTDSAFGKLTRSMAVFGSQTTACRASQQPLPCVTAADRKASQAFGAYAQAQGAISMPDSPSQADGSLLTTDAQHAQAIFRQLGAATSVTQYQQTVSASNLQQVLNQIQQTYQRLRTTLAKG